jgi:tetratricopeptide (TPR) repeat protein
MKKTTLSFILAIPLFANTNAVNSINSNSNSVVTAQVTNIALINSINDNKNTIVMVLKEINREIKDNLVNSLTKQLVNHFNEIKVDLKSLREDKPFIDYISIQLNESYKKNISLREQLDKAQKDRQEQLEYIAKLEKENKKVEYAEVLKHAKVALLNYDSNQYQTIFDEYQNNKRLQQDIKNLANSHYLRARDYRIMTQLQKALEQIKEAVRFDNKNWEYFDYYGYILNGLYYFSEAVPYFKKALELRLSINQEKNEEISTMYNNIAFALDGQEKYSEARKYYKKALKIWVAIAGENNVETATVYNNIGYSYYKQNIIDEALKFYKKALKIRLNILDKNHYDIAQSYNNISLIKLDQGKTTEAIKDLEKAIKILSLQKNEKYIDLSAGYTNLGSLYFSMKKYDKSFEYFKKAEQVLRSTVGDKHILTARNYQNLAILSYQTKKYKKAFDYIQTARYIFLLNLPDSYEDVESSQQWLEGIEVKMFESEKTKGNL